MMILVLLYRVRVRVRIKVRVCAYVDIVMLSTHDRIG